MVLLRLSTVNFCDNARDPVIEIKPERKLQWKDYLNSRCYRHKRDNMYIITITIYCNTRRYNPRLFRFHHLENIVVGVWFPNNVSNIMASVCFLLDGRKKIVRTHEGSLKRPCQARRATVYDSSQTKISRAGQARDIAQYCIFIRCIVDKFSYRQTTNKGNGTPSHDAYLSTKGS